MASTTFFKSLLKRVLTPRQIAFVKETLLPKLAVFCSRDLVKLAIIFGTDKWSSHWYAQHYQRHFAPLRKRKLTILEIGVGGYEDPHSGGASLRMWKWFFRASQIVGIDIYDKKALEEPRIRTHRGRQNDEQFLRRVITEIGPPDIVIDDGSHENSDMIMTFKILFPLLKDNGIYVVEDTQTSYWPSFGGLIEKRNSDATIMGFLKSLVDGLNFEEYLIPDYEASYYERHVVSMHFYHNVIFIYKGANNEGSNVVRDGRLPVHGESSHEDAGSINGRGSS